jgi:outer membrane protein OmpA-like peptidoglycan-associated protein/tetratricopeptide (TPR) repeat protein
MNVRRLFLYISFVFSIIGWQNTNAQGGQVLTSSSTKARGFFESAMRQYQSNQNQSALSELDKALAEDSTFIEALLLKADISAVTRDFETEISCYKKVAKLNPQCGPKVYCNLGDAEYTIGKYKEAKFDLQRAILSTGLTQKDRIQLKFAMQRVDFSLKAVANPVVFQPVSLGSNINSANNEYWPSLTADDKTMIFTIELSSNTTDILGNTKGQEDIMISHKSTLGQWEKATPISDKINTPKNEGSQSISVDNRLLFFTSCNRPDAIGHCDLYFTERDSSGWQVPVNAARPINSNAWDSQPSLASDGMTLYFVSNRPGGFGGMDIWKTTLTESGTWGEPVNLGDSINTPGEEMSPFIHPDNSTLYFSSDGHIGLGGQDIYMAKMKADKTWSKPINLGYPINTFNDETGLVVNAQGTMGYFASDRITKKGKDIFTFSLDKRFRPVIVTYVNGLIIDSDTKEEIKADFVLSDLETAEIVAKTSSIKGTGEYLLCLPVNRDYALSVSKKGYLMHSENFSLKNQTDSIKPYKIDISLQTIKVGRKEILRNVFFDVDKFELTKQSRSELNNLVKFLNQNPETVIEIGGHTDNSGTESHNDSLSENRAKVVYQYMINKGIVKERLAFKGYSSTVPASSNENSRGRSLNRRTEFKIIDIKKD